MQKNISKIPMGTLECNAGANPGHILAGGGISPGTLWPKCGSPPGTPGTLGNLGPAHTPAHAAHQIFDLPTGHFFVLKVAFLILLTKIIPPGALRAPENIKIFSARCARRNQSYPAHPAHPNSGRQNFVARLGTPGTPCACRVLHPPPPGHRGT